MRSAALPAAGSTGEAAIAMAIHAGLLPLAKAQYRFHPTRMWRFDVAWPAQKVALEIEGGTWSGGSHVRGLRFESDCEKYAEATILGWAVLRVTTAMCKDGRATDLVQRLLAAREG